MAQRKSLSKKTRFEVFKRDNFTCQYCGQKSPDVILEVDHMNPVKGGGTNDIMNLITSCFPCNRGKSKNKLSDQTVLEKQREQIEELNLRRQQLEMLLQWRTGLQNIKDDEAEKVSDYIYALTKCVSLSPTGLKNMKKHLKKFGLQAVLEACDISYDKYFIEDDEESREFMLKKIPAIAFLNTQPEYKKKIAYIKGIIRNRIYINDVVATQLLERFYELGGNLKSVEEYVKVVKHWTDFKEEMERVIEKMELHEEQPF